MNHYVDKDALQEFTTKLHNKQKTIFASKTDVGSPLVAATADAMTDTDKIYVYVGSETGYAYGDWYYYNGEEWTDGGVYNAVAIVTDTTLTESGVSADAKTVGDAITNAKKLVNDDDTPDTHLDITATEGLNYYISGGKLKSNSNSARASSALFTIPNGYNYMIILAISGFAVCCHEVTTAQNNASTIVSWTRPGRIIKINHNYRYVLQGAMRDLTSAVVLPANNVIAKVFLFKDIPNQFLYPFYDTYKNPPLDLLFYKSGNLSAQGIATDGTNILVCSNKGFMDLVDIKTKAVVKTVTFTQDYYGHMNDATYYDGKYYVPAMLATGEIYVFDASTLELLDTIIAVDDNGNAYSVWRLSYDKVNNKFYSAYNGSNTEKYFVYDTSFTYQSTISLEGSTSIDGSNQTYRQGMLTDGVYIYECNTSHDFAFSFIEIYRISGEYVGVIYVDDVANHELEGLAYDWDHDIMYLSYTNRQADPYDRGYKITRINIKSQPNIPKIISYITDVLM